MQGIYFDGVSSQPRQAEISIHPAYIEIILLSEEYTQPILWDHARIHAADIPGSSKAAIKYGDFPFQCIEVEAKPFYQELKEVYPGAHYIKTANNFFLGLNTQWLVGALAAMVGVVLGFYFLVLPFLVDVTVDLIPTQTEAKLGRQMADSWLTGTDVKIDKERTELVNQFYHHLNTNSSYDIRISVVDNEVKNAFALPGGQIVIFTGLLNEMKTYPELVALLGHEAGHIENRHTLKSMIKNLALYLCVSIIFQDLNGIMAVLVDNAASLQRLSYSRSLEAESDEFGLQLMLRNHIDPKGMKLLFERLKDGNSKVENLEIPEFLTTHPSIDSRISELENKLTKIRPIVVHSDSLQCYWEKINPEEELATDEEAKEDEDFDEATEEVEADEDKPEAEAEKAKEEE